MKKISLILCLFSASLAIQAQQARVVQLEHSLRWVSELNFPNFLSNTAVEGRILDEIGNRLADVIDTTEIRIPKQIDYRTISWFGKARLEIPKSKGKGPQIGIVSSITRATVGFGVLWSMQVIVQDGGKVIIEKEVEHELEPYSISIQMSSNPWLVEEEFEEVFLYLLDECLGRQKYRPGVIELGSIEIVREQVAEIIPIENEYRLAVKGAMMAQSNAAYKLMRDSTVLHDYIYRDVADWDIDLSVNHKQVFAELFSAITGISTYYNLKSTEKRLGEITTFDGKKRRIRLDWLEENRISTDGQIVDGQILSPITGQFFEEDQMISHFIVYGEVRPVADGSLHDMQFQQGGGDFQEAVYHIVGSFRQQKFEVIYHESEAMVLIVLDGQQRAILSLINTNPESMSSGGVRLSKNKKTMIGAGGVISTPEVDLNSAEWYPLYVVAGVDDLGATEMGLMLLLLFFSVAQTGG